MIHPLNQQLNFKNHLKTPKQSLILKLHCGSDMRQKKIHLNFLKPDKIPPSKKNHFSAGLMVLLTWWWQWRSLPLFLQLILKREVFFPLDFRLAIHPCVTPLAVTPCHFPPTNSKLDLYCNRRNKMYIPLQRTCIFASIKKDITFYIVF